MLVEYKYHSCVAGMFAKMIKKIYFCLFAIAKITFSFLLESLSPKWSAANVHARGRKQCYKL